MVFVAWIYVYVRNKKPFKSQSPNEHENKQSFWKRLLCVFSSSLIWEETS